MLIKSINATDVSECDNPLTLGTLGAYAGGRQEGGVYPLFILYKN